MLADQTRISIAKSETPQHLVVAMYDRQVGGNRIRAFRCIPRRNHHHTCAAQTCHLPRQDKLCLARGEAHTLRQKFMVETQ